MKRIAILAMYALASAGAAIAAENDAKTAKVLNVPSHDGEVVF